MRRATAVLLFVAVLAATPTSARAKEPPERARYDSIGLSASWHTTRDVDRDTYRKVNWYVSAYLSREGKDKRLWSSLYERVYRCEREKDRDRCKSLWYAFGRIRDIDDIELSMDPGLESASLEGTYRVRRVEKRERVGPVARIHVTASLAASGEVYRSRGSYASWDGKCPRARYRYEYSYRRARAVVTLDGDVSSTRIRTRGWMNKEEGFVLYRDCD
ncbi:MAG TPA: hypothetical protein VJN50_07020 [Actinomycetota bacterium]|nr:hypothetical protein [Actinomycetota bacterium]